MATTGSVPPASMSNSAFWGAAFEEAGKAVREIPGSWQAINGASGFANTAGAFGKAAWAHTGENVFSGMSAFKGGNRAVGVGRMLAGAGTAWLAAGAINIFRPGDNAGLF